MSDRRLDALDRALALDELADDPLWEAVAAGRMTPEAARAELGAEGEDGAALAALFAPLDEAALAGIAADAVVQPADPDGVGEGLARALSLADAADDPRWVEVAAGQLDAAGLEAEDADAAALAALFTPVDVDAIEARLDAAARATAGGPQAPSKGPPAPDTVTTPDNVVAFPRRWRGPVLGVALALAAAAALWVARPGPALPDYAIELSAGDQAVRGTPGVAEAPTFRRDSLVDLVLRPATAIEGEVGARAELVGEGEPIPVELAFEVRPGGAVTYAGAAAPLFVAPPGRYTLRVRLTGAGAEQVLSTPLELADSARP